MRNGASEMPDIGATKTRLRSWTGPIAMDLSSGFGFRIWMFFVQTFILPNLYTMPCDCAIAPV